MLFILPYTSLLKKNNRSRAITPKARLVPLSSQFLSYLRADGIRLPPEDIATEDSWDDDSSVEDDEHDSSTTDPCHPWQDIHAKIKATIAELNGSVMPKLNWSAPKDATWIAATNSMECSTANDVYLLLKSSDFVTHDLEQVFDDCQDDSESEGDSKVEPTDDSVSGPSQNLLSNVASLSEIPYYLVLRKTILDFNPAVEFRCFVRDRNLLCMCQRDLNYFSFLSPLVPRLRSLIQDFFNKNLQRSFPDQSFTFDIYIPPPHKRVWLIDINPWAPRTDPILFSWLELLTMRGEEQSDLLDATQNGVFRLSLKGNGLISSGLNGHQEASNDDNTEAEDSLGESTEGSESEDEEEEDVFTPEFRLVNRDDPEAYNFNTPQYSAHKLPKDVVDASNDGESGLRDFLGTWREIVAKQEEEDREEAATVTIDEAR